jgi:hypothetical protein
VEWIWYAISGMLFLWLFLSFGLPMIGLIVALTVEMFRKIWDKETVLSWSDGAKLNAIMAVSCAIILFIFIFHASRSFTSILVQIIKAVMIGIFVVGFIRLKIKFALSFLFTGLAISIVFAVITGVR